nr:retrovirus-related Pol polyprotein from transposon TNT 1-94 [Tanacetum cinerariifolium]
MDVWVLVPALDNISPLTLKWIFKNKNDEENTVIRNKSRLVVRGYHQEEGLNFKESFAPVARMEAIMIFLAYAAHKSFYVFQMDVKTAFLHGTIDPTLFIRLFDDDILVDSGFELTGFSDVDYARCKDTFKSTSGRAQFLGENLVSWSLKKQDCTALSIAEAEYVSLSACCAQVLWMRTQLTDYGFHFKKILIYRESKSAIAISCNPVQHSRTKHIAVRYRFIKEHVEKVMNGNPFRVNIKQLCDRGSNTLSWKPCQGGSSKLNLPAHRISRWRYNLIPAESRFKTPCSIVKDKYMMKAQVHMSTSSAISDVQALLQKETLSTRFSNNTIMSNKMLRQIVSELSRS